MAGNLVTVVGVPGHDAAVTGDNIMDDRILTAFE